MVTLNFNGSDGTSNCGSSRHGSSANGGKPIIITLSYDNGSAVISYGSASQRISCSSAEMLKVYARGGAGHEGYRGTDGAAGATTTTAVSASHYVVPIDV